MTLDGPEAQLAAVQAALRALGAAGTLHQVRAKTPQELAAQVGADPAAVVVAEVFAIGHHPLLVLSSAAHRADPFALASLLGVNDVQPATPHQVRAWTGQEAGAIAPVGHPHPIDTLVDVELAPFNTVWCWAGHPGWAFPSSYAELLRITAGEAAEVGDLPPGTPVEAPVA